MPGLLITKQARYQLRYTRLLSCFIRLGVFSQHIDGFLNIPVDELRERLGELDKGKPVYVICQSGLRSYIACRILAGNGFECYNFSGGFRFYDAVMNDRCLIESATACGMDKSMTI